MARDSKATVPIAVLLDNCASAALVADAAGRVVACNLRLRRLVGHGQPVGRPLRGLFDTIEVIDGGPPVYRRQTEDADIEARASTTPLELPDGPGRLMVFTAVQREPRRGTTRGEPLVTLDHAVLDASSFSYYRLEALRDADGDVVGFRFVDVNPAAERELGLTREQVLGLKLRELHPVNETGGFFAQYRRAFLEQRGFEQEYVIPPEEPMAGWYTHEVVPLADGVAIFNRDIARYKAAELALRQILDTVPDPMLVMGADGIIRDANAAAVAFFGYDRETLVGGPVTRLMPADYAERHQRYVAAHLETGRSAVIGRAREVVARLADGREVPVRLSLGSMQTPDGPAFVGTLADLRPLHGLQDELRTAQKMEALGRLAGGVAHDFNNLLQVIIQNAQLLELDLPDGEPRELVDEIRQAGQRSGALTRQLLQFSRRDGGRATVVGVAAAVEHFARMGRRLLAARHALVVESRCDDCAVVIDPTHFDQVLLNLVVNARDAMPDGGVMRIRTERVVRAGAPTVRISVEDEGFGMAPEVLAHVFDPFFSTKGAGGTGLGLSTVFGIVSRAGGHTRIESAPGVGTRVIVELPLAEGPSTLPPPPRPATADRRRAHEVVLVVGDPLVRASLDRWLSRAGFAVRAFAAAETAWSVLAVGVGACLVSDVEMPGMTGVELAERMERVRPETPVVLIPGDPTLPALERLSRTHVLAKPFSPDDLSDLLYRLLPADDQSTSIT